MLLFQRLHLVCHHQMDQQQSLQKGQSNLPTHKQQLGIPYFLLPYHFAGQPNSIIVCVQERGGGKVEEQNPPFTLKPFI